MRILHLSRAAETLWWFMIPTLAAQQARGHEILLCTEGADAARLREHGFHVVTHGMRRSLNPWGALRAVWTIRRTLRQQRIDALVCHNSLAGVVGRLAAWLAGTRRVIYFAHGLACGPAQGRLSWQVRFQTERLLAPLTDNLIVMNDYDERLARGTPLARSAAGVRRIRGMGVDLARFQPGPHPAVRARLAAELGFAAEATIVLCVARLIPEKGVLDFAAAAQRAAAACPQAVFLLAGSGPLLEALREQVGRAGAADRVKILGWRSDVRDLMGACDLFVLPSYYMEGLPVSLLEAMACGKPVITTRHKGCEDAVVDGETARLVPVRQPERLAAEIAGLLDDAAARERLGAAGRARVEQVFALESCTAEIVATLEEAVR